MIPPEAMAALHGRAFAGQGRGWSADEFAALLDSPHVFALGDGRALCLGRVVADEAEVLTIAVAPDARRQGLGQALLARFEQTAAQSGAARAFLEVAADNVAARALYARAGYGEIARRTGYYLLPHGRRVDALILQKQGLGAG